MPINVHDTELEEFCQEFEDPTDDEEFDFCHFPIEPSMDFDDYVADKDPERILAQMIETGQVALIYDLLEHISHTAMTSFSGMIIIYADKNEDGTYHIYQDIFNSRSGIADRQSCTVINTHGRLHIDPH